MIQTGHTLTADDRKIATPSVLMRSDTFCGVDRKRECSLYLAPSYTSRISVSEGGTLNRSCKGSQQSSTVHIQSGTHTELHIHMYSVMYMYTVMYHTLNDLPKLGFKGNSYKLVNP